MESARIEKSGAVTSPAGEYERMLMLKPGEVRHLRDELAENEYHAVVDLLFDWFLGRELPDGIEDNEVVFYAFSRISHRMEVSWVRAEAGRKGGAAGGKASGACKARFGNQNASKTQSKTQSKNAKQNGSEISGNELGDDKNVDLAENIVQETQAKRKAKSPLHPPIIATNTAIATSNNNINNITTGGYNTDPAIGGVKGGTPSAVSVPDKRLTAEQEELERIRRYHPTIEDVKIAAHNTGVPMEYAEKFYRDMCETDWSYVNRYGRTATVNKICLASVLRARYKAQQRFCEEDAKRSGKKTTQPTGVKLSGDWDKFDFTRFGE